MEDFKVSNSRATYSSNGGKRQIAVTREGDLIKRISIEQKEFYVDLAYDEFVDLMKSILGVCKSEDVYEEVLPDIEEELDENGEKFKY